MDGRGNARLNDLVFVYGDVESAVMDRSSLEIVPINPMIN